MGGEAQLRLVRPETGEGTLGVPTSRYSPAKEQLSVRYGAENLHLGALNTYEENSPAL